MSFPTPNEVQQLVFISGGEDILGNEIEMWGPARPVRVICYMPSAVTSFTGYSSRVESDVDMAVPPTLAVSTRDRFILPGEGEEPFEVIAIEDACHGFDPSWQPGNILKLKRVTGGG